MKFPKDLKKGTIISSYSSLIADVEFEDGKIDTVFLPRADNLKKLYKIGTQIWAKQNNDESRKIKYEAIIIENDKGLVMTNPDYIKPIFTEAFKNKKLKDFNNYSKIEDLDSEAETRLTFRLSNENNEECYVYVCCIYNKEDKQVVFPSFVDFREFTVYSELKSIREQGIDTYFVILIGRTDHKGLKFCWSLDPVAAAKAFEEARDGLKFICYSCNLDINDIDISDKIDIKF